MSARQPPLNYHRMHLPFKGVLVRCLDESQREITHASGFIRRDSDGLYLYTCWHVVTGYDRNDLRVSSRLPNRAYLSVEMQRANKPRPGVIAVGGVQKLLLPLYDTSVIPKRPLWHQDDQHNPHPDLNSINLFVPRWHDAVRLPLPPDWDVPDIQVVEEQDCFPNNKLLVPGDKLYVVGFPYSFSVHGPHQPTSVVLTRFVAATRIGDRLQEILLESTGAPGMSGGPVFVERSESIYLLGLYTGELYPDHVLMRGENDKRAALGTCTNLYFHLLGHLPLVLQPSQAV